MIFSKSLRKKLSLLAAFPYLGTAEQTVRRERQGLIGEDSMKTGI
jgi:hypothetical protein